MQRLDKLTSTLLALSYIACSALLPCVPHSPALHIQTPVSQKLLTNTFSTVQVLFHAASSKLITASQDGLVAVHELSGGLNQDDGFIAALNVGTSVEQLGLYGSGGQHMWCRWAALVDGMQSLEVVGCRTDSVRACHSA